MYLGFANDGYMYFGYANVCVYEVSKRKNCRRTLTRQDVRNCHAVTSGRLDVARFWQRDYLPQLIRFGTPAGQTRDKIESVS